MSNATSTLELVSWATGTLPLILGALLAVFGGWLGYEIRARRDDSRELNGIKLNLCDELVSIMTTITTMHQTWTRATTLYPADITDLSSNTSAYESLKTRLFLIKDEALRREIRKFYKEFKDLLTKSDGKVGTLADTEEAKSEQQKIHDDFEKLGTDASLIKEKLAKATIA
jgi:hypothetical protein